MGAKKKITSGFDSLMSTVMDLLDLRIPFVMWGSPGMGKTAMIENVCRAKGWHCETIIASIREPTDFLGLPDLAGERTTWRPPDWVYRLHEAHARGQRSVLFLDELSTAGMAVQAALLRVVNERRVGDMPLPETTAIAAAANPPAVHNPMAQEMASPTSNRWAHLQVDEVLKQGWLQNFPIYWGDPPVLEGVDPLVWNEVRAALTAAIRATNVLMDANPSPSEPWASPRTWDFASRYLAKYGRNWREKATAANLKMFVGTSGRAVEESLARSIPDAKEILSKGGLLKITLTHPGDAMMAVNSLVEAIISGKIGANMEDVTESVNAQLWGAVIGGLPRYPGECASALQMLLASKKPFPKGIDADTIRKALESE